VHEEDFRYAPTELPTAEHPDPAGDNTLAATGEAEAARQQPGDTVEVELPLVEALRLNSDQPNMGAIGERLSNRACNDLQVVWIATGIASYKFSVAGPS